LALFFAGGLARLLAWAATGQPNWFYVVMIPVELIVPLVNWALIRRVSGSRRTDAARVNANA
jgi:hypothetical protein